jgi:Icc-related predicted phosphoesterase
MDQGLRVAALADLHYGRGSGGMVQQVLGGVREVADVLVLCGDLTDFGSEEEARLLAKDLAVVGLPMVAVLGNHDFESGQEGVVSRVLVDAGVQMLDGDAVEIGPVGFAGVKGFAGGFGRGALGPWGEPAVKAFVQEAVNESMKLERALARLRTLHRVAVLHYAPIFGTVDGEPPEIYPYLGSGRLEEPLTRYPVDVVFHGHAHNGQAEGLTSNGIPVHNVSLPLMRKRTPGGPLFKVVQLGGPATVNAFAEARAR